MRPAQPAGRIREGSVRVTPESHCMTNPESALSHREESISDADSRRKDVPGSSGWAPDSTALRLRARFRTSSLRNHLILKVTSREGLAPTTY